MISAAASTQDSGECHGLFGKWHNGKEGLTVLRIAGLMSAGCMKRARMATISHNGKSQRMAGTYPTDLFFKKRPNGSMFNVRQRNSFVYLHPNHLTALSKKIRVICQMRVIKNSLVPIRNDSADCQDLWVVENIDVRRRDVYSSKPGASQTTRYSFIEVTRCFGNPELYNAGMKVKRDTRTRAEPVCLLFRWPGGGIEGVQKRKRSSAKWTSC